MLWLLDPARSLVQGELRGEDDHIRGAVLWIIITSTRSSHTTLNSTTISSENTFQETGLCEGPGTLCGRRRRFRRKKFGRRPR